MIDLLNKEYGDNVVIKFFGLSPSRNAIWVAKCKHCGRTKKYTKFQVEQCPPCLCRSYQDKYNRYIIGKKFSILIDNQGNKIKIDTEDVPRVKQYTWSCRKTTNGMTYVRNAKHKMILHRFILQCPTGSVVDHINHDTLDNRKCNLRVCTLTQNKQNSSMYRNNTSGYTGVYILKNGRYRVNITVDKKNISLGCYSTLEEAAKVRKEVEEKYFGEYRRKD